MVELGIKNLHVDSMYHKSATIGYLLLLQRFALSVQKNVKMRGRK